jgi:sugar/nucleoside kinase (ribokinase family)
VIIDNIDLTSDRTALCMVGFVYFETYVPAGESIPEAGTEQFVPKINLSIGAAFTSAAVAHSLGCSTVLCYPSGEGLADHAIRACIKEHAIPQVSWAASMNPAVSVVFSSEADRAFISSADFDCLSQCPTLPKSSWVHSTGLRETLALEHRLVEAQQAGAKISVSTSWVPDLLDTLLSRQGMCWDLLVLNRMEAERVAGSVEDALTKLSTCSTDRIITLGKDGAVAVVGGTRYQVAAQPAKAIDPTGAGDAFCAGYLCGQIQGKSPDESLELASRTSSLIVQSSGSVCYDTNTMEKLRGLT